MLFIFGVTGQPKSSTKTGRVVEAEEAGEIKFQGGEEGHYQKKPSNIIGKCTVRSYLTLLLGSVGGKMMLSEQKRLLKTMEKQ